MVCCWSVSEPPEMLDMFPDMFNPGSPGPFEKCVLQDGHALIIASDGLWDAFSDDDAGEELLQGSEKGDSSPFLFLHLYQWKNWTFQESLDNSCITGWWFGTFFIFPYIGKNHPNWLCNIFQRGRYTTNRYNLAWISPMNMALRWVKQPAAIGMVGVKASASKIGFMHLTRKP